MSRGKYDVILDTMPATQSRLEILFRQAGDGFLQVEYGREQRAALQDSFRMLAINEAFEKDLERERGKRTEAERSLKSLEEHLQTVEQEAVGVEDLRAEVSHLEQERTRLHTGAGEDDRTYAMVTTPDKAGEAVKNGSSDFQVSGSPGETSLVNDSAASLYDLENGPPAELPPLEPDESATGSFEIKPLERGPAQKPLSLKEVPELDPEQDEGLYIEESIKKPPKRSFLWLIPILLLAAAAAYLVLTWENRPPAQDAILRDSDSGSFEIARLFRERQSGVVVEGAGRVEKLLPDDLAGSRHQRFILRLATQQTILVSHNIDLAPRLDSLRIGDEVRFRGQYEWNPRGGVIQWPPPAPGGERGGGWLRHDDRIYR